MGTDASLNAQIDPTWMRVILTARGIRNADLRAIAEAFAADREHVIAELAELAAALDRPAEGFDEAIDDFEANVQLDEAALELDETDAMRLADELTTAGALTYTARRRPQTPVVAVVPLQMRGAA